LNIKHFHMDTPTTYRIRVQGTIDASLTELLGKLRISESETDRMKHVTTLAGKLPDQAALCGVLMALYDFRFPLLSVEIVNENDAKNGK